MKKLKKYHEITVKAADSKDREEIYTTHEKGINYSSKKIIYIDMIITCITMSSAAIYLIAGLLNVMAKVNGMPYVANWLSISSNAACLVTVIMILINKVKGDQKQQELEKEYKSIVQH